MENVRFTDLKQTSAPMANKDEPLTIRMRDVSVQFHESATDTEPLTLGENCNTVLMIESAAP